MQDKYEVIKAEKKQDKLCIQLRHRQTGANICTVFNNDKNKVFYIAFKTPVENNTGVAHVLEHLILRGSSKYETDKLFSELAQKSYYTYINGLTFPDRTIYPIASCNNEEFSNLISIYMDCVFSPLFLKERQLFDEEVWIKNNFGEKKGGIVYNEMLGVYSNPLEYQFRNARRLLFSDTRYGFDAGGIPEDILNLSYIEVLKYYEKYYHPSNSYIYLYGDIDMIEKLEWLDTKYLSNFNRKGYNNDFLIQTKKNKTRIKTEKSYRKNSCTYCVLIDCRENMEISIAFEVLEYLLFKSRRGIFKRKLEEKKMGGNIIGKFEEGLNQSYFVIYIEGKWKNEIEYISELEKIVKEIIEDGLDIQEVNAAINHLFFKECEMEYSMYPKGLLLGLKIMEKWIYNQDPFMQVEKHKIIDDVGKKFTSKDYEHILETYILKNENKIVIFNQQVASGAI